MRHRLDQGLRTRHAKRNVRVHHAIDVLFTASLDNLLQFTDVKQLLDVRLINKVMKVSIDAYVIRRIANFLARWVAAPFKLQKVLQETRSVISGSGAAYLIVNPKDWVPHDLDIFTPQGRRDIVVNHLINTEGYEHVPPPEVEPHPTIGGLPAALPNIYLDDPRRTFLSVVKLRKRNLHGPDGSYHLVDVVESATRQATSPILSFPSTTAMNWIESDRMFCAYPELTLNGLGMLNGESDGPAAERTKAWRDKYELRGFTPITSAWHVVPTYSWP